MFLKTLTLKGFKSFAETTTLDLEPGITVVVGPNGSGKSNIVDAVAWVLGAQGPRTVRSVKMEDVIFAGTSRRAALGRAEVGLTIDNSEGLIPLDFSEITITRTLWRSGESEYAINGAPCRLLDVQELLSDTGVGRQQHVIVGQGQLDAVLNADPVDRRLIVEEAAGVLKFRRRREKAQRRLESTEGNLLRVQDLLREVRRQLRPLERQADAARRHGDVVAELRALQLFLAGRELAALRSRAAAVAVVRAEQSKAERELVSRLDRLDTDVSGAEAALVSADEADQDRPDDRPTAWGLVQGVSLPSGEAVGQRSGGGGHTRGRRDRLADDVARAEGLKERARGLSAVVAERRRSLERLRNATIDAGLVASLESEAAELVVALSAVQADAERLAPTADDLAAAEADLGAERAAFEAEGNVPAPNATALVVSAAGSLQPSVAGSVIVAGATGDGPTADGTGAGGPAAGGARPSGAAEARAELAALRNACERAAVEQGRLEDRRSALVAKAERSAAELAQLDEVLRGAGGLGAALAERAGDAVDERVAAEAALEAAEQALAACSSDHRSWSARAEALASALDEARARAGAERLRSVDGLIGTLLDVVEVDPGWEPAFEAAIGEAVAAVVVDGVDAARRALAHLHADGAGGAVLALPHPTEAPGTEVPTPAGDPPPVAHVTATEATPRTGASSVDAGVHVGRGTTASSGALVEPVRAHVRSSLPAVEILLDRLLGGAVAVDGPWSDALDLALDRPGAVVVTRSGDRFADAGWRTGVGSAGATGAALEEARARASIAESGLVVADEARAGARRAAAAARSSESDAARAVDRHASERAQATTGVARAERELRELAHDSEGLGAQLVELVVRRERDEARVGELAELLPQIEAEEAAGLERAIARRAARGRIEARGAAVRALRTDLEVRAAGLEERRALLSRRKAEVEGRLSRHLAEREIAERRRVELGGHVTAIERLAGVLARRTAAIDDVLAALREQRRVHTERTAALTARLDDLRRQRVACERELVAARERLGRAELEEAEVRVRTESSTDVLRRELDCEAATAMASECPPLPPGTTAQHRARELERDLRLMGPINPLALDEHAALIERHEFLEAQLDDVKAGRRELAKVIRAIDAEIIEVFSAAYADVADNFAVLFEMLFPGGTGRLRLTDLDNLLETGIEVEARPSGKNVKRLSLLSGGERSLTAMAFLFAVFRSRPSPFYLMDEVEAALDDVNLHRFLDLVREFRTEAQLLIVSHQKRTMEAADCLYGVTMQPGGSSRVISERVSVAS